MCALLFMRKMHNNPVIKLEDTEKPVVDEYKFTGVIFDNKLTFIPHIKYSKMKSTQAQQFLWVVVHTEWGADRQTLLKLYRSLIRSQLDYAIFIYGSARRSNFKRLDPIHYEDVKLVLGAFRTSPLDSYTSRTLRHLYNSDVKNWLSTNTQSSNLAHPTQLMNATSTLNTSNVLKQKKNKKKLLAFGWSLLSRNLFK